MESFVKKALRTLEEKTEIFLRKQPRFFHSYVKMFIVEDSAKQLRQVVTKEIWLKLAVK